MNVRYRYTKPDGTFEGELPDEATLADHHAVVRAVLQRIASDECEVVVVDMMSVTNPTLSIGKDVFYPASEAAAARTIQTIEISEDGTSWKAISVVLPTGA